MHGVAPCATRPCLALPTSRCRRDPGAACRSVQRRPYDVTVCSIASSPGPDAPQARSAPLRVALAGAAAAVALLSAAATPVQCVAATSQSSPPTPDVLEREVKEVEELLGVQTLVLGVVGASALRVGGALTRDNSNAQDTKARPPLTLTATGARRALNITPPADPLLREVLSSKVDPTQTVESVMATTVLKAKASDSVASVLPMFTTVTGLPVVSDTDPDAVVGVFSKRDAVKAREADPVALWMTSPALTIETRTQILECAALMLKHQVHRLPVVDARGRLKGIITRSDVFGALLSKYKGADDEACSLPPSEGVL